MRTVIKEHVRIDATCTIFVKTPAWFLNSANAPKDRHKRGMRKGKRFKKEEAKA